MEKQRSVSYAELAAIEAAFTEYTKGVVFRDEEAKAEALSDYEIGYINFPEEEGGVDEYTAQNKPYLMPGIEALPLEEDIAKALKVELGKEEAGIAAQALDIITTDYASLHREGIPEAAPRLSRYAVEIVRLLAHYGKEYAGAVLGRATDADTYTNIALMLHKEKPLTDEEEEVAEILKKHALCK